MGLESVNRGIVWSSFWEKMFPSLLPSGESMLKSFYLVCFQIDWMRRISCTSAIDQNTVTFHKGKWHIKQFLKECVFCYIFGHLSISSVFFTDHKVLSSARQSVISEKSGGTPLYQFSPHTSVSHSSPNVSLYHSHNPLPREGERLSFTLEDTFRELDEFQEDPPLFLEENSWEGEESEFSDPTLALLNHESFQVRWVTLYPFSSLSLSLSPPTSGSSPLGHFLYFSLETELIASEP